MSRNISVLGSTGSIGVQALNVISGLGDRVYAITANRNVNLAEEQARKYKPQMAAMMDESAARDLRQRLGDTDIEVLSGMDGISACAAAPGVDVVLNAVVGMVGLVPTLAAINEGKTIALANKETLVAGGSLVMAAAKERGVSVLPVDSEHSAIFQSMQGETPSDIKRLILTASGGPFYGFSPSELEEVTPERALKHPNWTMGAKITIDCATMMNKGLELIEASWLFDMPPEKIEVVIHRESVIHSLVEYRDNAMMAQLGTPDMSIPIQYALTWPRRYPSPAPPLSLTDYGKLTFLPPDDETFPAVSLCREAARRGGVSAAALNGANEAAVALFLEGKIGFSDIWDIAGRAMDEAKSVELSLENILEADREARKKVYLES